MFSELKERDITMMIQTPFLGVPVTPRKYDC